MFEEILKTFENEDLRNLCEELIKTIPDYFYKVPASSTGKYHPAYALGEGGLYRHTLALCKIMNHMFEVTNYISRDRDLMRIAGIMHDTRKSGSQEEYEKNKYTNFDHPLKAAEVVRSFKGRDWEDVEIEIIADAISSHMGKWNTDKRSSIVLPTPQNKYQNIVHLCDYLASRKDIEIVFSSEELPQIDPFDYKITFGKHSGKSLREIPVDYLKWLQKQEIKDFGLKKSVDEVLKVLK